MSDMGLRKRSKKIEDIAQAAEQLFLQKGIRSVTVEEIVREAKVSKRTFYKYFSDKQDLVEYVLLKISDSIIVNLLGRLLKKGDRGQLTQEDFLNAFDINEYDRLFQLAFTGELWDDYSEMLQRFQNQWINKVVPLFRQLIQMAQENNILRKDIDADFFIGYTLAIKRAFLEQYKLTEGMGLKEFTKKFYDLYLYGIVVTKKEES